MKCGGCGNMYSGDRCPVCTGQMTGIATNFHRARRLRIGGGLPIVALFVLQMSYFSLAQSTTVPTSAHRSHWTIAKHLGEHILLGVGTYVAVSEVSRAGGDRTPYWPGLLAISIMAALKEGTDAHDGTDTPFEAGWHAATIVGAAGAIAAIRH